VPYF
jgi:hypothetical protein